MYKKYHFIFAAGFKSLHTPRLRISNLNLCNPPISWKFAFHVKSFGVSGTLTSAVIV